MAQELSKEAALAARKQRLVAEGQLYRVSLEHAKVNVAMALRPEALLHGVVDNLLGHAAGLAGARMSGLLSPGGINLRAVLPFLLTAGSFIMRRRLLKPAIGLGVVAGAAVLWYRSRGKTLRGQ
jgi:hypothetical protein